MVWDMRALPPLIFPPDDRPASRRPVWLRYGLAIALTLLAVWVRIVLAPAESGGRFVTAALAVAFSALYGGLGPGLVSTVLGMVLVNFFLVAPYGSLAIVNPSEAFWLNAWHLMTQLVVIGAISLMQRQNRQLRQAGEQIRESQQRFLDTFEHAASGICHVDTRGRLLRANLTFCSMMGYTQAELERMRFQDITLPEDLDSDLVLFQETLAGQRTAYTLEKRYRHKAGRTVWAQLTVALMRKPDGEPDYFISVVHDISVQKAAEEALRTSNNLLDQAQKLAGVVTWQADLVTGRITSVTDSSQRLPIPYADPYADYAIADVLNHIHPDDRPQVGQLWFKAIQGEASYQTEYRVTLHGRDYWLAAKAEFVRDAQGRAVRALGVTQDITGRKRIELEIQRLNTSLEQRIQARTRALKDAYDELESYSYAVAHDLRSPLRIINGFAQALREDNPALGTVGQDHLARIMGASKTMGELIDGLLKLSQFTRGKVQRLPVDLSAVATRILEELSAAEPRRVVGWEIEPALQVQADPALIEALMQNLLHNAWKYTAEVPTAHIRVFSRGTGQATEYSVSDNGAGFDMSRAAKLFQPFQRLHKPHEFSGLGIGLATAWRIVQRHGGTLRAEGRPGQGATFSFTLPPVGGG